MFSDVSLILMIAIVSARNELVRVAVKLDPPRTQARLRHRLQHVWGAHISLINEFRTSKCCCQCGAILSCIFKRRNKHVILKKAQKIRGVLRCEDRDGNRGHGFVHRDKNAAVNIMSIYEALADEEKKERPIQFRPVRGSRYS